MFRGNFRDSRYVVRGTDKADQSLDADMFGLSNSLSLALRRGDRVWQIYSNTLYNRTPRGGISVTPLDDTGDSFRQLTSGSYFYNSERTSLSWLVGPYATLGFDLLFNVSSETFWSGCYPDSKGDDASVGRNDVSFTGMTTSAKPYFQWRHGGLSLKLRAGLALTYQKVGDKLKESDRNFFDLYPDADVSLLYKLGYDLTFNLNGAYRRSTGGIRNFVTTPVYSSYRMLRALGSGRLGCSQSFNASGGMAYREIVTAVFASVNANMSRTHYNAITFTDVSDSQTVSGSVDAGTNADALAVRAELSKRFRSISTTAGIVASCDFGRNSSLRDGKVLVSDLSGFSLKGSVDGSWLSGRIIGGVNCSYARFSQKVDAVGLRSNNDQIMLQAKLSLFMHESLELYGNLNFVSFAVNGNPRVNHYFVDAGLRFRKSRWEIALGLNNITDQRTYFYSVFDGPDYISYNYRLRPFEAIVVLRTSF